MHLTTPPMGVTPIGISTWFWHKKTRVHGLSCSVVFLILCLVSLIEHWLVTDRWTQARWTEGHSIYRASMVFVSYIVVFVLNGTLNSNQPTTSMVSCDKIALDHHYNALQYNMDSVIIMRLRSWIPIFQRLTSDQSWISLNRWYITCTCMQL